MIEKITRDYLAQKLSVPVLMEKPAVDIPRRYVLVEKTSSSEADFICRATIALQSYAPSLYGAALLNSEVKAAMADMVELDDVSKVALNTDYNYTNTATKEYRYQAIYDLTY